ncbi:MAG TPA: hypothetical protein VN611_14405 [Patescibacteria group bacterium]|nr:hypothetical protein [Patescibacteria group bacterium]
MSLELAVVIGGLVAAGVLWYYWRCRSGLQGQARQLTVRLEALSHQPNKTIAKQRLTKILYRLFCQSVNQKCPAVAYQAIDLLKLALGEGMGQSAAIESQRLSAGIISALRQQQPDIAGHLADAFKPLLRRLQEADTAQVLLQIGFVSAVALKDRQNFIAAKLVEVLFLVMEKMEWGSSTESSKAVFRTLKLIGVIALRRHDVDLFRELLSRIYSWVSRVPASEKTQLCADIGALLFVSWLHRIIQSEDQEAFEILTDIMETLVAEGVFSLGIQAMVAEWRDLGSSAGLYARGNLGEQLMRKILTMAAHSGEITVWSRALEDVGRIIVMALSQRTMKEAFGLVRPLLETGRGLLAAELRFRHARESTAFFRQALQKLLQECILLAEYLSRQDMTSTVGDIIEEMYGLWNSGQLGTGLKYKKRFCQLLLYYWVQTQRRKARRFMPQCQQLALPILLTEREQQQLGFLEPIAPPV